MWKHKLKRQRLDNLLVVVAVVVGSICATLIGIWIWSALDPDTFWERLLAIVFTGIVSAIGGVISFVVIGLVLLEMNKP